MRYLLTTVWLTAAATSNAIAQAPGALEPAFRVGDAVRVTVLGYDDLSGQFEIGENGTVVHPVYRTIRLVGMSMPQADSAFRTALQRFETNPDFIIEPMLRIWIGGEVRSPNIYTIIPNTTVPQAIAQAGGALPTAKLDEVRLLRRGTEIEIDLTRPQESFSDLMLQSADQIILDRNRNVWRDIISPVLTTAGSLASIGYLIYRASDRF